MFNQELKGELKILTINGFINNQRIHWLGQVMRRSTEAVTKIVLIIKYVQITL